MAVVKFYELAVAAHEWVVYNAQIEDPSQTSSPFFYCSTRPAHWCAINLQISGLVSPAPKGGGLAQLGEHYVRNVGVAGSTPVPSTKPRLRVPAAHQAKPLFMAPPDKYRKQQIALRVSRKFHLGQVGLYQIGLRVIGLRGKPTRSAAGAIDIQPGGGRGNPPVARCAVRLRQGLAGWQLIPWRRRSR